jgi:hypothetical protein
METDFKAMVWSAVKEQRLSLLLDAIPRNCPQHGNARSATDAGKEDAHYVDRTKTGRNHD